MKIDNTDNIILKKNINNKFNDNKNYNMKNQIKPKEIININDIRNYSEGEKKETNKKCSKNFNMDNININSKKRDDYYEKLMNILKKNKNSYDKKNNKNNYVSKKIINTERKQTKSNQKIGNLYNKNPNTFDNNKEPNNHMFDNKDAHQKIKRENEIVKISPNFIPNNHTIGLKKMKEVPFMNAVLQCLANIKQLTNYFLANKEEIKMNGNKHELTFAFFQLIENLWTNKAINEYTPYSINYVLNSLNAFSNNIFKNYPKDLIILMLETLHKELNNVKKINLDFKKCFDKNLDFYFKKFEKYFKDNFQSIISDLFYFKYDSKINCFDCNTVSHNIQYSNILLFPLKEVKEFIGKNKKKISIEDCFKYYQKSDYLINTCNNCKQRQYMDNSNIILIGPKILIINLIIINKNETKFILNSKINLKDFIYYKDIKYEYELISVMSYLDNGDYIAFCKSFADDNWYEYDNSIVDRISFEQINLRGVPRLLFYSLIEN